MKNKVKTVWIVDDDDLFFFYANRMIELESLAENVEYFKNPLAAIYKLEECCNHEDKLPDVILLDIYMPFLDGWEFYKEFVEFKSLISKEIVLYMASCSLNLRDIEKVKTLSLVKDFIVKPVTPERLKQILLPNNITNEVDIIANLGDDFHPNIQKSDEVFFQSRPSFDLLEKIPGR
jgi:two-component SAPR family response regulator